MQEGKLLCLYTVYQKVVLKRCFSLLVDILFSLFSSLCGWHENAKLNSTNRIRHTHCTETSPCDVHTQIQVTLSWNHDGSIQGGRFISACILQTKVCCVSMLDLGLGGMNEQVVKKQILFLLDKMLRSVRLHLCSTFISLLQAARIQRHTEAKP